MIDVTKISSRPNGKAADLLREMATRLDGQTDVVSAIAVTIVHTDGSAGSIYAGTAELALIGALDVTKQRIVDQWPK